MQTIYEPKGKAREYAPLALNIYTGCSHGCTYCYMRPMHERFHGKGSFDTPVYRTGLITALSKELDTGNYSGKLIHLCFSCDPYPAGIDTTPTRDIITLLKLAGCHVQILTKGGVRAERDFDLLDGEDWFGVTFSCGDATCSIPEPRAAKPSERLLSLQVARERGIRTWASCEPVLSAPMIYWLIQHVDFIDLCRIGKLNYHSSDINWHDFGHECERLAKQYGRSIQIKDELRQEMERG